MSAEIERQNIICYLELERSRWLPLHVRAERAGGMSAEANLDAELAMRRIDPLLEELHKLGSTALHGVEHAPDSHV